MKFGKDILEQQKGNSNLKYLDYKRLKKVINERKEGWNFQADLQEEMTLVRDCFMHELVEIKKDLIQISHSEKREENDDYENLSYQKSRRICVQTKKVNIMRHYIIWNAVASIKILKKHRKQIGVSQDCDNGISLSFLPASEIFNEIAELIDSLSRSLCVRKMTFRLSHSNSSLSSSSSSFDLEISGADNSSGKCCCQACLKERSTASLPIITLTSCGHRVCWKCLVFENCPVCGIEQKLDPSSNYLISSSKLKKHEKSLPPMMKCSLATAYQLNLFCSLCCEPLLLDSVITTSCNHFFHKLCFSRYDKSECPLCNERIHRRKLLPVDDFARTENRDVSCSTVNSRQDDVQKKKKIYWSTIGCIQPIDLRSLSRT